jgi:type II secretory pathway pseudopilin PulG
MKSLRLNPPSKRPSAGGFSLLETLIAGSILAVFALGTAGTFNVMNRLAGNTRIAISAQNVVRGYIDEAMAADYSPTSTPSILANSGTGTDIDGDGEVDGDVYASNVPLIVTRDSKTAGVQNNVVTGTVYRHCTTVDATLGIQRVNFLIRYTLRGKNYYNRIACLKAREK